MKSQRRWVIATAGVVVMLLVGLVYAWSVMSKTIGASRPTWSATQLSLTFTLVISFFCIGCLAFGFLGGCIKARLCIAASGVLLFAGFFIASLAGDSPVLLYLGFGILCGFAAGMVYNAVMSCVLAWFPDKQGFMSGLLLMGFGISGFIVGKIFVAFAPPDGQDSWVMVFRALGAILCAGLLLLSPLFAEPDNKLQATEKSGEQETGLEAHAASGYTTAAMVKNTSFWMYYVWAVLTTAAGMALVSQASGIATQIDPSLSAAVVATLAGLTNITNGLGRVSFGALYDRAGYRRTMGAIIALFLVSAGILFAALKLLSLALVVVGFCLGGFAYGGVAPTNSAIVSDFFGRAHYAMNFSVVSTNLLIASFSSVASGALFDATQSYMATIGMIAALTLISFAAYFAIKCPSAV